MFKIIVLVLGLYGFSSAAIYQGLDSLVWATGATKVVEVMSPSSPLHWHFIIESGMSGTSKVTYLRLYSSADYIAINPADHTTRFARTWRTTGYGSDFTKPNGGGRDTTGAIALWLNYCCVIYVRGGDYYISVQPITMNGAGGKTRIVWQYLTTPITIEHPDPIFPVMGVIGLSEAFSKTTWGSLKNQGWYK